MCRGELLQVISYQYDDEKILFMPISFFMTRCSFLTRRLIQTMHSVYKRSTTLLLNSSNGLFR